MITQTQAIKFKSWFINYLNSNGSKAMDNLSPYEFLKIFPQITSGERERVFNFVKSFTPVAFEKTDANSITKSILNLSDEAVGSAGEGLAAIGIGGVILIFILYKLFT